MPSFDRRLTPARPDLAAAHLKGIVEAADYAEGVTARVVEALAPLRVAPRPDATLDTEALYGEELTIYDEDEDGWAWVQLARDGYVGYAPGGALLKTPRRTATHVVTALRTFIFPARSIKEPPVTWASLGAELRIVREVEDRGRRFGILDSGGAVVMAHVRDIGFREADPVAVAERFLGAPYLWGGKSSFGIDCSGLVQTALAAAGIAAPRDSDLQEANLGEAVALDPAQWRRGDILCWPGHVAFVRDADTILHANAFHMAVAVEGRDAALARITAAGNTLRSVKRVG